MKLKFSEIPKVCINLERNKIRRDIVSREFEKIGIKATDNRTIINDKTFWKSSVFFIPAVDKLDIQVPEASVKQYDTNANGILACAMSHMEVIKRAKDNYWPVVCIFEDDVVFCDDFKERLAAIEAIPDLDFDIFCLGGHFDKIASSDHLLQTKWNNIYQIKKMGGTYALIITEKCYDFILRNWNYNYGADELYGNFIYRNFNTYGFVPFLCGTYPNKSDITDGTYAYDNVGWYYQQHALMKNGAPVEVKTYGKKQLMDCTFIVPIRVDSRDREFNFMRVIQYLCDNLRTNIIIGESDLDSKVLNLLKFIDRKECTITHLFERSDAVLFHRTKMLNKMLSRVETPVVVNYDVDCLLRPEVYEIARDRIIKGGYDLIYPYGKDMAQVQVAFPNKDNYRGEDLFNPAYHSQWGSLAGHIQFFKTSTYREGGMENECFLSYGPEDRERMERFIKLGYRVDWCEDAVVFHLQHQRGVNSGPENPLFGQNEALYHKLINMTKDELIEYYGQQEYIKQYKK